jgi:hypothetical protein
MKEATLYVSASDKSFRLIVEPWSNEFEIVPNQRCRVIAKHPRATPTFEVEVVEGMLVAYINESGATFEFGVEISWTWR